MAYFVSRSPSSCLTIGVDLVVLLGSSHRQCGPGAGESTIYPKITLLVVVTMMLFYLADLYDFEVRYGRGELCLRAGLASLLSAMLIAAIGYGLPWLGFSRLEFLSIVSLSTLGLNAFRIITDGLSSNELAETVLSLGAAWPVSSSAYGGPNAPPLLQCVRRLRWGAG